MGTPQQRATYDTLHTATLAMSSLRGGLTSSSSVKAAPALRRLLGASAIAIADRRSLLAYEGSDRHIEALTQSLHDVVRSGAAAHGARLKLRRVAADPMNVAPVLL